MNGPGANRAPAFMIILAFAIVYIVWGSTYLFIKKALFGIPPFLLGALRFGIAGLLLLSWCKIKGEKIFVKKNIINAAITGVLLLFIGNGTVIWVEQFMPTAMVAITLSSGPLWFIVLDKSKWKENFRNRSAIAGLVIGFVGVILLFGGNLSTSFSREGNTAELGGLVLLCAGAISWSAGSLYSKYHAGNSSAAVSTAWQMLAGGAAFLPVSLIRGEINHLDWQSIPLSSWLSLLYLIFFGSIVAFSAYVWLLQVRPAAQVSTHSYVNPVVAVVLGIIFADESISWTQAAGLSIILGSVLLINFSKNKNGNKKPTTIDGSTQANVKFCMPEKLTSQFGNN